MLDTKSEIANQIEALDSEQVKSLVLSWLVETDGNFQDFQKLVETQIADLDDALAVSSETEAERISQSLEALEEYKRTGQGVSHERVQAWIDSLGTDDPLPCPK
jgi:predicted transcriptional regulator